MLVQGFFFFAFLKDFNKHVPPPQPAPSLFFRSLGWNSICPRMVFLVGIQVRLYLGFYFYCTYLFVHHSPILKRKRVQSISFHFFPKIWEASYFKILEEDPKRVFACAVTSVSTWFFFFFAIFISLRNVFPVCRINVRGVRLQVQFLRIYLIIKCKLKRAGINWKQPETTAPEAWFQFLYYFSHTSDLFYFDCLISVDTLIPAE